MRVPEDDVDQRYLAVTLDRPQFFDAKNAPGNTAFSYCWDGPCKIRLYVNLSNRECYCAFIVYPRIQGDTRTWSQVAANNQANRTGRVSNVLLASLGEVEITRVYEDLCIDLALSMLRDFVLSGAANGCGIEIIGNEAVDINHLRATFGPRRGKEIEQRVRNILRQSKVGQGLFRDNPSTLPLFARAEASPADLSRDIFSCRRDLLGLLPQKHKADLDDRAIAEPIAYADIFHRLNGFTLSTVGQVLDYELDWGTVKPVIAWKQSDESSGQIIAVWRAFFRGEFDPWFETGDEKLHGHDDAVMQRTLGIGPTVVESFLKRTGKTDLNPTHFAKLFANLRHDWRTHHGGLSTIFSLTSLEPIPLVEELPKSGKTIPFERFLLEHGCLLERTEKHGSQIWRRYRAADESRNRGGVCTNAILTEL